MTPSHNGPDEHLFKSYSGKLLGLVAGGSFLAFLGRGALPPLLPEIINDLNISSSEAGLGLTLLWLAYATAHYPGGRLSDELSRKVILIIGLIFMILGFSLLISLNSFRTFLLGVCLIGLGHGIYYPSSRGLIGDLFIKKRSQALGLLMGATAAGTAMAAGLSVVILSFTNWQSIFLPVWFGLILITVLLHIWQRDPYNFGSVTLRPDKTLLRIFSSRRLLLILVAYTGFAITWQGVMSFLPTLIHLDKGFPLSTGGLAYGLVYIIGIFSAPVAGNIGDRFSRGTVAGVMIAVCLIGFVGLITAKTLLPIVISVTLFAIGMWGFPPTIQAVLLDKFPNDNMGADIGGFKMMYTGIGSLGPLYIGIVAEWESYTIAYMGFIPMLSISLLALILISRPNISLEI